MSTAPGRPASTLRHRHPRPSSFWLVRATAAASRPTRRRRRRGGPGASTQQCSGGDPLRAAAPSRSASVVRVAHGSAAPHRPPGEQRRSLVDAFRPGSMKRAHADRRDVHDRAAVLDGAEPADRELLRGLGGVAEGRVVRLHDQDVARPPAHGVAHRARRRRPRSRSSAPTRIAARRRARGRRRAVPGDEVCADEVDLRAEDPEEGRSGMYSAKGTGCRLT